MQALDGWHLPTFFGDLQAVGDHHGVTRDDNRFEQREYELDPGAE